MDYYLNEEQKALQKEWDKFYCELMKDAPKNWRGSFGLEFEAVYGEGFEESTAQWVRQCWESENNQGYLNLHWPEDYGGKGIGVVEQLLLNEIKSYYGVPMGNSNGLSLLAPQLFQFGTEEQKGYFLPRILTGETWFTQIWSEPGAGSDLASLISRAVKDGDEWIVNGQKTWISSVYLANWGFSPFRTDPDVSKRHRGLTYFIYPLDTPGITIRPLYNSSHRLMWREVYFDDVRIPDKYRIGEVNHGWYVTMATANSERSGARFGEFRRHLEELIAYCKGTRRNKIRLIDAPLVREDLANLALEIEKLRVICYRSAWKQTKGEDVTMHASAAKILDTELVTKMRSFVVHRIGGPYAQMRVGSELALFDGVYESQWECDLGTIINMGTNDIQHNVIASRWGLNLPGE